MTDAVLVGSAVSDRLSEQLRSVGVTRVHVVDDLPGLARAVADGAGDVLIGYADIVTQREALAGLLLDPRVVSGVLASDRLGDSPWPLRTSRGRLESASSSFHTVSAPNGSFLGIVKVASSERATLAAVIDELERLDVDDDDLPALVTVGLVRAGVPLTQSFIRELFWARVSSPAELEAALADEAGHDEEKVLLNSAVKATDGFFTTFFVSPYSKYIARWAARRGLTPNAVTMISLGVGIVAAAAFATGERWGLIAGAVLLQAAFTPDCVDGQLARYTRQFSKLGAWLDSIFDRTKEYLVFAGLAIGAARTGHDLWLLAASAMTVQCVRHAIDFSYPASQQLLLVAAAPPPLEQVSDRIGRAAPEPDDDHDHDDDEAAATPAADEPAPPRESLWKRWRQLDANALITWVKKILVFPIGERFFVISLTAAIWNPRVTFIVLLAWGGFATLYSLPGRILRTLTR